jgi:hypothetical protein
MGFMREHYQTENEKSIPLGWPTVDIEYARYDRIARTVSTHAS